MEKNGYAVGEIVYIEKYRMVGEIIGQRGSQYELQAGSFTFLVDGTDLSKADEEATSNYVKEKPGGPSKRRTRIPMFASTIVSRVSDRSPWL